MQTMGVVYEHVAVPSERVIKLGKRRAGSFKHLPRRQIPGIPFIRPLLPGRENVPRLLCAVSNSRGIGDDHWFSPMPPVGHNALVAKNYVRWYGNDSAWRWPFRLIEQ